MSRYVPKTYNNRRVLRLIFRIIVIVSLTVVILFIALFFGLRNYYVDSNGDGVYRLEIPWLMDEPPPPEE